MREGSKVKWERCQSRVSVWRLFLHSCILGWAASQGIPSYCLHNVGIWILISSSQILFWYELLPTAYGPQKSEKIKVLKSKLWIFLCINKSQIEILNTFLCIPCFSFQKMSSFCNFQKFHFQKNCLKLYNCYKKWFFVINWA